MSDNTKQLYKKSSDGSYPKIFPLAFVQGIKDKRNNKELLSYINEINHFKVDYNENPETTRCKVDNFIRKKGLYITYYNVDTNESVTEYFKGNQSDVTDDNIWGNSDNWELVPDKAYIENHALIPDKSVNMDKLADDVIQAIGDSGLSADEEDLTDRNSILKFKDREYNIEDASGLGYKILRKNWVEDKNILTQNMINEANTIYEIRYDFDLGGATVVVPENCILKFNGGTIINGTIVGNNTQLECENGCLNIVLDGSIRNKKIYGEWFGIKAGYDYKDSNNTIFEQYLVPSIENIELDYPSVPKILVINTDFHYSYPLVLSGKTNIEFNGQITYEGEKNTTALRIGRLGVKSRERSYKIYSIDGHTSYIKNEDQSINDYIGVDFWNIANSSIEVDYAGHFSYPFRLYGNSGGCVSNIIKYLNIGKESYTAIKLLATGEGWVNENLFIGGSITNYSSNPCHNEAIGIHIDSSQANYLANANFFIKPNLEGQHIAFKVDSGNDNHLFNARLEVVQIPIICDGYYSGGNSGNTIIYSDKANLSLPTKSLSEIRWYREIVSNSLPILLNKQIRRGYIKNSDNKNCLVSNMLQCKNKVLCVRDGEYYGELFDVTSENNILTCYCDEEGTLGATLYDLNDNPITITSENQSQYIELIQSYNYSDSHVSIKNTTAAANIIKISVKNTVSKVFVGRIRTIDAGSELIMRGVGFKLHKLVDFPTADGGNFDNIRILDTIKFPQYHGFYKNMLHDCSLYLYGDIDLMAQDVTLSTNLKIFLMGGKLINGIVRLSNVKIIGDFGNLLGDAASLTGSSFCAIGTTYWQNGKPTWSNGTNWVDATGQPI